MPDSEPVPSPPAVQQIESPPPSPQPQADDADDARVSLNRLAMSLAQRPSSRMLIEFLRLRRALRTQ